jgi:hypothetical protein
MLRSDKTWADSLLLGTLLSHAPPYLVVLLAGVVEATEGSTVLPVDAGVHLRVPAAYTSVVVVVSLVDNVFHCFCCGNTPHLQVTITHYIFGATFRRWAAAIDTNSAAQQRQCALDRKHWYMHQWGIQQARTTHLQD